MLLQSEKTSHPTFRFLVLAFALFAAVVVCILYVDRPLADFFEAHVRHTGLWLWLHRALRLFDLPVLAALFFLLGCGVWVSVGRRLSRWTRNPLLCSWSTMWAVAAVMIFKQIFGRGDVDPTYIRYHLYGFRFLHGIEHWQAFPSGTAGIATAIAAVLWITAPRLRVVASPVAGLLAVTVVIMNYHWISDVIAGVFLGAFIGWSTVRLCQ